MKRLQIGFVPKSGLLLPTRTTIVPDIPSPEGKRNNQLNFSKSNIFSRNSNISNIFI